MHCITCVSKHNWFIPLKVDILLDEAVFGDQILELILADIIVINAMLLSRSRTPRCVGDGKGKGVRVASEEKLAERTLTDPRRAGNYERASIRWYARS